MTATSTSSRSRRPGPGATGVIHYVGAYDGLRRSVTSTQAGNIVAADLNGAGKPSIALVNGGTGQIEILLADPASNQFLPVEDRQRLVIRQRDRHAGRRAVHGRPPRPWLPRPHQRPVHTRPKQQRHLDQDLPRRHRHPVQLVGTGDLRIRPQRQHLHLRLRDQRRGRRRAGHDHRPGGSDHDAGL